MPCTDALRSVLSPCTAEGAACAAAFASASISTAVIGSVGRGAYVGGSIGSDSRRTLLSRADSRVGAGMFCAVGGGGIAWGIVGCFAFAPPTPGCDPLGAGAPSFACGLACAVFAYGLACEAAFGCTFGCRFGCRFGCGFGCELLAL